MDQWLGFGALAAGAFVFGGAIVQIIDEAVNAYGPASLIAIKQQMPCSEVYLPLLIGALVHKFSKSEDVKTVASALIASALMNAGQDATSLIPGSAMANAAVVATTTTPTSGIRAFPQGQGDFRGIIATPSGQGDFRGIMVAPKGRGDFQGGSMKALGDFTTRGASPSKGGYAVPMNRYNTLV